MLSFKELKMAMCGFKHFKLPMWVGSAVLIALFVCLYQRAWGQVDNLSNGRLNCY